MNWNEEFEKKLREKLESEYRQANTLIKFAATAQPPEHPDDFGDVICVERSANNMVEWIKTNLND